MIKKYIGRLTLLASVAVLSGVARAENLVPLHVDAARAVGPLTISRGVNGVPAPGHSKPFAYNGGKVRNPAIDVSAGYKMAHVDLVRTHDSYGAGDIDAHFGPMADHSAMAPHVPASFDVNDIFPDMVADPALPASYHWAPTDQIIASITAIGAEPLFRIGRSEGANGTPPADPKHYAEIVRHIVLHYNQGWDHGMHAKIRYWEVWNEPDLGKIFWNGTPEQFYALYDDVSRAIKSADPHALVGAPPLAEPLDATLYREALEDHIRKAHDAYDFQPFHWYDLDSDDTAVFGHIASELHKVMAAHGFAHVPLILDEWNGPALMKGREPDIGDAAFTDAALIAMQNAPISAQTIYRGDDAFGADGASPNALGQALIAWGEMAAVSTRLAASVDPHSGLSVLAGKSADGQQIEVLIADYRENPDQMGPRPEGDILRAPGLFTQTRPPRPIIHYTDNRGALMQIDHLPPGRKYHVEIYQMSKGQPWKLSGEAWTQGGSYQLTCPMQSPAVELVRLTADTRASAK